MSVFATAESTLTYSKKFSNLKYKMLGKSGLYISQAGFGGYRVHNSINEQREALRYALTHGINIVDTSSNYGDGGSEELIGSVIKDLQLQNKIKRQEIVVVSKAGYLQGQNFQLSQQLKKEGNPFADIVEYSQNLEHCIHPDFIEDQLTRSLQRLNMETIDVFLLHNPEYYLLWCHTNGIPLKEAQTELFKRIEKAFLHLEIEVQNGRIQHYGISSNSFPIASDRYDFLELEKIWDLANSISKDHHFRMIQLPFNLLEKGAVTEKNQSSQQSVLEYAARKSLGVLINRPLNAFYKNQLLRLSSIILENDFDPNLLSELFGLLIDLESDFIDKILPKLQIEENKQKELSGLFSGASYLQKRYQELGPYWQWLENQARFISEQTSYGVQLVNEIPDKDPAVIEWLNEYVELFNNLLGSLTLYYGHISHQTNEKILSHTMKINPGLKEKNLQDIAIASVMQTAGVSSVLVGMRQNMYVKGVIKLLGNSKQKTGKNYWSKLDFNL